ncbi:winged helix-turn-helix domain-containing protein [Psychroserpens damuponensis]|uniref:winged helix-turn-helix domain-containing protein n=1 Tax=Psychroserpens damuponensis TaxID=943936 RepID=UPI000694B164|nr:winged helix-turn-helix domain-containing protein [Psychroserpens damuponensis]
MNNQSTYYKIFLALSVLLMVLTSCTTNDNFAGSEKTKVALREAGHQLLLRKLDSTSLVLPIKQIEHNIYSLSFEKPISLEPTHIVSTIDSSLSVINISKNYLVEVIQCVDDEVAYSYEMNIEEERTLIPCSGRNLPEACYIITVNFLDLAPPSGFRKRHTPLVFVFGVLCFLAFKYWKKKALQNNADKHTSKTLNSSENKSNYSEIGTYKFYPEEHKLVKSATEISLSKKECELLEIFVANPNQIIKREELTKQVWEDNGVFVGRSLDTYISKLRKILKDDDAIKITNVHGVGYKLEVK